MATPPMSRQQGFALLVTITLLSFLVLLLVSLASLTRVETQVASNSQVSEQARQNALFSLNLALGALQRQAGPDQRATSTAALKSADAASAGTFFWTGVWTNNNAPEDYRSVASNLGWLVSGNEATHNTFLPNSPVVGLAAGTTPTASLTINGAPASLLVGSGTVEQNRVSDYVVAPLQRIEIPASSVPGLAGGTPVAVGRYAWWIGDEGVKTRLNVVDRWAGTATTAGERINRLLLAQRPGIEAVFSDDDVTPLGSGHYAVGDSVAETKRETFRSRLAQVLNYEQARFLPGFDATTPVDLPASLKARYHDFTTSSAGVLADQRRGGLRKDLTVLFETDNWTGSLATSLDDVSYNDGGARRIADFQSSRLYSDSNYAMVTGSSDARSPVAATWERLRDYYRLSSTNAGSVAPLPALRIIPLVLSWKLSFGLTANADGSGGTMHYYPEVSLWNPFNATLSIPAGYRVRFELGSPSGGPGYNIYLVTPEDDAGSTYSKAYHAHRIIPTATPNSAKYYDRDYTMEFKLSAADIPPGEALVFTPGTSAPYVFGSDNILVNALNPGTSFTLPVTLPGGRNFTDKELADTALVFATQAGGSGGNTFSFQLLDENGDVLQLMDSIPQIAPITVDSATAPTRLTNQTPDKAGSANDLPYTDFVDITFPAERRIGFGARNALQMQMPRYTWLAHYNPRALSIGRNFFDWSAGMGETPNWVRFSYLTKSSSWTTYELGDGKVPTAPRHDANGSSRAIMFYLPHRDAPLRSLGQLQHAELSYSAGQQHASHPFSFTAGGQEPAYIFGNAYADPRIPQNRLLRRNTNAVPSSSGWRSAASEVHVTDTSYLLNHALWDRFFFSTSPAGLTQAQINAHEPLPNGRLHYLETATPGGIRDFDRSAANLMSDGAFNVNSTSVEAWTALLGSLRDIGVDPADGGVTSSQSADSNTFVRTPLVSADSDMSVREDRWAGFRKLTDAQIRSLATAVVQEVHARGPFLSLADFVNRKLVPFGDDTGLRGTLQAAIDAVPSINATVLDADLPSTSESAYAGTAETVSLNTSDYYLRNIQAPRGSKPTQAKSAMSPGFLTQADLLQALGPGLAARSDTFVIRAYGETVNPLLAATDSGYITGRAWCEAVVQRLPEYVEPGTNAWSTPASGSLSETFGRRFEIVSFRWLHPDDI